MNDRKISTPILRTLVLALVAGSPLLSRGEPIVTDPNDGAVGMQTAVIYPSPLAPGPAPALAGKVVAPAALPKHTSSYTVIAGDSLTSIAKKFDTTRKKLRTLNNLTASTVKPGEILLVPTVPVKTAAAKAKTHHYYAVAQPVQDFDVPASTFASCPVPLPSPEDDPDAATSDASGKPAPIAKLVSPSEMAAEQPPVEIVTPTTPAPVATAPEPDLAPVPRMAPAELRTDGSPAMATIKHASKPAPEYATTLPAPDGRAYPQPYNPPAPKLTSRSFNARTAPTLSSNSGSMQTASANDWGNRFFQQARLLGNEGIEYDEDWRPPGEARSWEMDCSNTSRYLYKVTAGIQLPRTASDQYYYLHLQGKAWDVPLNDRGFVDTDFLRRKLKPGDLLFWENTYRPERQPPITHVMVYLGTNEKGQWLMAGSQSSRGGEHNRPNGGPDIYVFRPSQPRGGYTTWLGMVHHKGRFCAFGRPLEADPTKLSVAEND